MTSPAQEPYSEPSPRDVTPHDRQPLDVTPPIVHEKAAEPPASVPLPTGTEPAPAAPSACRDWSDRDDRYEMIAEAAYFKAERRGFGLGDEELDWLEAEEELYERLGGDHVDADD